MTENEKRLFKARITNSIIGFTKGKNYEAMRNKNGYWDFTEAIGIEITYSNRYVEQYFEEVKELK